MALYLSHYRKSVFFPFRRQDTGYSWRNDQAQAGRYKAFIQADVDIVDRKLNVMAESEVINAMITALKSIDIKDFTMCINHIRVAKRLDWFAEIHT